MAKLTALASRIRKAHRECEASTRNALAYAQRAGDLLHQAKVQVRHGQWERWVSRNCAISIRTAQIYMRIASKWSEVKAQPDALLTLKKANQTLAKKKNFPRRFIPRNMNRPATMPDDVPPAIDTGDVLLSITGLSDSLGKIIVHPGEFDQKQKKLLVESLHSAQPMIARAIAVLNS